MNHPGRKPGSAQPLRMTPTQLRSLLARSGITQQQAADLAGVALGTLKQYLRDPEQPGARAMPASASGLLCLSLAILGSPSGLMAPWVRAEVLQALETRWMRRRSREAMQASAIPSTGRRSRAVGGSGESAGP
jgi:transcriptional regulator with XRE-family HTH domain